MHPDRDETHEQERRIARLVERTQAGESEAFGDVYVHYFRHVFSYLSAVLRDNELAEDAAQEVFTKAFAALPRYERREQPFSAWLFTIVRNQALADLKELQRSEPVDPAELDAQREHEQHAEPEDEPFNSLHWITDPELYMFVERLPLVQRQVLLLRYLLDLPSHEVARILGRSHDDVRRLQSRAVIFLRKRLIAIGRGPAGPGDRDPMRAPLRKSTVMRARRYSLE